jgi:hypothetical protein
MAGIEVSFSLYGTVKEMSDVVGRPVIEARMSEQAEAT